MNIKNTSFGFVKPIYEALFINIFYLFFRFFFTKFAPS